MPQSTPSLAFFAQSPAPVALAAPASSFVARAAKPQRLRAAPRPTAARVAMKASDPPEQRVVVTGMGIVSCFGLDVGTTYDALLAGQSGVKTFEHLDVADWSTNFGAAVPQDLDFSEYLTRKQLNRFDPFMIYAISAGKQALKQAGYEFGSDAFKALDPETVGILCGSGMGGLLEIDKNVGALRTKGHKRMSPFFIPHSITNMGAGAMAIELGFMGPNYSISTACATGNFAIHNAAQHILRGDAEVMLAGSCEASCTEAGLAGFIACRALSTRTDSPATASRPWDKSRDGFVLGEGAGLLVLETLARAKARGAPILAEYLGGAFTCDAHHITEPRKDGRGVRICMERAMKDAGVTPDEVGYVNAHATSTPAGDMAEYAAVRSVFGSVDHVKMNGTKSMIGHALGGASALEAVVTIEALRRQRLHPTINVEDMEEGVDIDICANEAKDHTFDVAISNSFGFGGHNSTAVFGRFKE